MLAGNKPLPDSILTFFHMASVGHNKFSHTKLTSKSFQPGDGVINKVQY